MIQEIYSQLETVLLHVGITGEMSFSTPPNPEMGDLAFACFSLAKEWGKKPNEITEEIQSKIKNQKSKVIQDVKAFGPYVNFFLDKNEVARLVLEGITSDYGKHTMGEGKTYVCEFAHPNTLKAFHVGHLRNISTGESLSRIFENAGYTVHRVNYQGDVGMHIAKSLWGVEQLKEEYQSLSDATPEVRAVFLGKAYATGAQAFESDETAKEEILKYNERIYTNDPELQELYQTTRNWSLEYFDTIYKRVGTDFERLYFESEVAVRGKEIVLEYVNKGVFVESEGAVIFEGSKCGLHDRVFINSKGFPTYEGKEIGLAELQSSEYDADKIIHITGSEQSQYFAVVFAAIAQVFPALSEKEEHIPYGWVRLKNGKMSSRMGQVVLGEDLLDAAKEAVQEVAEKNERNMSESTAETIAIAAIKYAFLSTSTKNEIAFDLEESISTSGNSGPYLLYIVARINSILKKINLEADNIDYTSLKVLPEEHALVMQLAEYPAVTREATEKRDTSVIAKYLFDLAQAFNSFYAVASVVDSEGDTQAFRVQLIHHVRNVMRSGLEILGIETVDEM